jgi:AcrR family transcriptional regulator
MAPVAPVAPKTGMKPDHASDTGGEDLRADAERNRQLLLQAAREVFAEQGLQASSKEIARPAGVGIATLFRRFPTRQGLLVATFGPKLAAYTEAINRALNDPDPWRGFCPPPHHHHRNAAGRSRVPAHPDPGLPPPPPSFGRSETGSTAVSWS